MIRKHFHTLMYLGIVITLLAITFNFLDILQKSSSLTGHTISEEPVNNIFKNIDINTFINDKIKFDSDTPYKIYNLLIASLSLAILIISIRFIYKSQT